MCAEHIAPTVNKRVNILDDKEFERVCEEGLLDGDMARRRLIDGESGNTDYSQALQKLFALRNSSDVSPEVIHQMGIKDLPQPGGFVETPYGILYREPNKSKRLKIVSENVVHSAATMVLVTEDYTGFTEDDILGGAPDTVKKIILREIDRIEGEKEGRRKT